MGREISKRPVKNRKSPYRHRVKEHKRLGRPVQTYMRGIGDKTKLSGRRSRKGSLARSRVVGDSSNSSRRSPKGSAEADYDITIYYFDYKSERLSVDAKDYPSALTGGLEQRDTIEPPKIIRMRKGRVK